MTAYIILGIMALVFIFLIYLFFEFVTTKNGANAFMDKWTGKTLWIWLPFYALQRLIKDVILGQGRK